MAEHTDTERLDFILRNNALDIDSVSEGYLLRVWFSDRAAQDAGFDTGCGNYIAKGASPRSCIDNAIDHQLKFIG